MATEKTSSPQWMKNINQQRVLNIIYSDGPISRVEIAEKTKLTQQTISNIVGRLLQEKLVIEGSPISSNGGRKPIPLMINRNELYAIGIDVTVKKIGGILIDFAQHVIAKCEKEVERFTSGEHTLSCIIEVIDGLLTQVRHTERIKGIGVSIQGLVNQKDGSVLKASEMHWREFQLKDKLEKIYPFQVHLENDVNMIAVFENLSGLLVPSNNNITFKIDQGIGGAIVIDKKLYAGSQYVAGEFGHYKAFYGEDAFKCHCGGRGCLTTFASIGGLEKNTGLRFEQMLERLQNNDPYIIKEFDRVGEAIGHAVANIVTIFNPDHILFTGKFIEKAGHHLLPIIENIVRQTTINYCRDVTIISSQSSRDGAVMAAGLVIKDTFKEVGYSLALAGTPPN
jgi:transcriptional regulator of PTS gene